MLPCSSSAGNDTTNNGTFSSTTSLVLVVFLTSTILNINGSTSPFGLQSRIARNVILARRRRSRGNAEVSRALPRKSSSTPRRCRGGNPPDDSSWNDCSVVDRVMQPSCARSSGSVRTTTYATGGLSSPGSRRQRTSPRSAVTLVHFRQAQYGGSSWQPRVASS